MNDTERTGKEGRMQIPVCDKGVSVEQSIEISLPDYEREVRRLLRVGVTVLPPMPYVGGGNAEFGGQVKYDILYASPEGRICQTTHFEKIEVSAPLEKDCPVDYGGEITALCDIEPESVVSRALAPRRLSVKCRMRARIRAYGDALMRERCSGEGDMATLERLEKRTSCVGVRRSSPESFETEVREALPAGVGDSARVVWGEAVVSLPESTAFEGGVNAQGALLCRALVEREDADEGAMPILVSCTAPISLSLESDGFHSGMKCRAVGACENLSLSLSEGSVVWNVTGQWMAEGILGADAAYTEDAYSTATSCSCEYVTLPFLGSSANLTGHFTQSLYENAVEFRVPEDAVVTAVFGEGVVEGVTRSRGKWAAEGQTKATILLKTGDEYATAQVDLPFRYEFEAPMGAEEHGNGSGNECDSFSARVQMLSGRGRLENGNLGLDLEMEISLWLCREGKAAALAAVTFGEPLSAETGSLVAFPGQGDDLWTVAKRYHTTRAELRRINHLSEKEPLLGAFLLIKE